MNKIGKNLSIRIFVTGENLEKLDKIREYLNSRDDVKSGSVERWKKTDVYELIFNDAIEEFKL